MRIAAWLIFGCFVLLAGAMFLPAPASTVELARAYFSEDVIARGQQYAFERRWLSWGEILLQLAFLLALVVHGWGKRWAEACLRLARGWWLPTVVLLGACIYVAQALLGLPFAVGRYYHMKAWGLTERPLADWFAEYGLGLGVTAVIEGIVLVGLYLLVRWLPRWWWLAAATGTVVLAILFAMVLPVLIAPLFNTFTPIEQTQWANWQKSLHTLIEKADVPVQEILVMNASKQSTHTNAYFTGFGATRRIVLYDNLLAKHTLPEVESILAHEIGHWLHDHIVQGIALGGVAALVGFYFLARILRWAQTQFGLYGPSDPKGLPIILLAGALGSWLVMPVGNFVSRHFERQADMMALELARQPDVFIEAEKKLAIDNISNVTPTPWGVWLFSTHPPAVERIQMAQEWKKTH